MFIFDKWKTFAPYFQSALRIISALIFITAGTMKLFAFPMGMPPDGSTAEFMTQVWIGGFLEVFGGLLIVIGFYTRPAAFILSGEMAVAYFQFHAQQGFWPTMNGGIPAILYCFIFLYFSAAGAGPLSVDSLLKKKTQT
ncbi:MAG: DoxX family protein [Ignavibacteriales bacterium]|nr:DoxX family protein [Ignavibacteriales bacterium]